MTAADALSHHDGNTDVAHGGGLSPHGSRALRPEVARYAAWAMTERLRALAVAALVLGVVVVPGCKRRPRANESLTDPLAGTFEGKPFDARGSIAWVSGLRGDLFMKVFDRPAICGTASDTPRAPSERFISIHLPWWGSATPGMTVPVRDGPVDVGEASVNAAAGGPSGGESGSPLGGRLEVVALGPTGGTIALDVGNDESKFRGRLAFVVCQPIVQP